MQRAFSCGGWSRWRSLQFSRVVWGLLRRFMGEKGGNNRVVWRKICKVLGFLWNFGWFLIMVIYLKPQELLKLIHIQSTLDKDSYPDTAFCFCIHNMCVWYIYNNKKIIDSERMGSKRLLFYEKNSTCWSGVRRQNPHFNLWQWAQCV